MKILHVSPSYFPAFKFGGPIQSVHLLNQTLASFGIDIDVFTTNAGLANNQTIKVNQWIKQNGVNVKYFSFLGYEHYNFSIRMFISLLKEVKKYDLVHITAVWNFPVWAACFACWINKKPYIISPRGTIYPETIAIKSAGLKKMYYQLFAKRCLAKASALHFTSDDEKQSVIDHLKLPTAGYVIPNGINLVEFSELINIKPFSSFFPSLEGQKYLLFLGRINQKKGLDILLPAFKIFLEQFPGFHLVIAGPDNEGYKLEMEALATHLQIANNIFYTGSLSGEAKLAAYKSAGLFVLTSYSENFGMSVVEAMACSCPVLISDKVGIYKEILANNAGFVSTNHIQAIAGLLVSIAKDDSNKRLVAENGHRMAFSYYNIETVAREINNLYKLILKNRHIG